MTDAASSCRSRAAGRCPAHYRGTRAVRIHEWELRVIPGLLQTEGYARSVISAGRPHLGSDALDRNVSDRMARQRILTRDDPSMLWACSTRGRCST